MPGLTSGSDLEVMRARAVSLLRAGKAEEALQLCVEALVQTPSSTAFDELATLAAIRSGRFAEAEVFARRSLDAKPDHLASLMALGHAMRAMERHTEAAAAFERAQAAAPDHPGAAFLLCAAWLQARDPRAAPLAHELLARFPLEAAGWEDLGKVLSRQGKPEAALACSARALRVAPSFGLAMRVGVLHRDLGQPTEAAVAFRLATELDPAVVRAWFLLGLSLQDMGERDEAASAYRTALDRDPSLAEAAVNLGTVLQEAGDLEGAKAAYGRALATRGDTFGRIAQAMTNAPKGELWLDLGRLRRILAR